MIMTQENSILKNLSELINHLSELTGICSYYYNFKGERIEIPLETKEKILSSMGFSIKEKDMLYWIEYFENYPWREVLEPVYVNTTSEIFLYLSEKYKNSVYIEIMPFEELSTADHNRNLTLNIDNLNILESKDLNDSKYFKYSISIPELAPGYYKIKVFLKAHSEKESFLIVTPDYSFNSFNEKKWGLHLNLWSIRGNRKEGDFSLAEKIASFVNSLEGITSISPLHLNDPENKYGISPYSALSREFKTPLYLARYSVEERNKEFFDYKYVFETKLKAIRDDFENFYEQEFLKNNERAKRFILYKNSLCPAIQEDLKYFAVFCFLRQKLGKNWQNWDESLKKAEKESLNKIYIKNQKECLFFEYIQWLVDEEIKTLNKYRISTDLGFGSLKDSFDVWLNQDIYAINAEYGAPPDDFNPKGQKWGFPPVIPFKLKQNKYLPFIKILKSNMGNNLLRIDHALGLFRAFWIPDGDNPEKGAYVKHNWKDLLGIICLESLINKTGIIVEDLGTGELWMKEELIKRKMLSWKVFYFEKNGDIFNPSSIYPSDAICSITTHDLPTFKGYWYGKDIQLRKKFSIFDNSQADSAMKERHRNKELIIKLLEEEGTIKQKTQEIEDIILGIIKFLSKTPCKLLLLYLEDLFLIEDQTNLPGTVDEYPNWQKKIPFEVDEIINAPVFKTIESILKETGRLHH